MAVKPRVKITKGNLILYKSIMLLQCGFLKFVKGIHYFLLTGAVHLLYMYILRRNFNQNAENNVQGRD